MNLHSLIKIDQFYIFLHGYTQEFNISYSYWKDDISVMAASYLNIGGLKVGALRADLMTSWQADKYDSLIFCMMIMLRIVCGARLPNIFREIVVPLLLILRVRHLWR